MSQSASGSALTSASAFTLLLRACSSAFFFTSSFMRSPCVPPFDSSPIPQRECLTLHQSHLDYSIKRVVCRERSLQRGALQRSFCRQTLQTVVPSCETSSRMDQRIASKEGLHGDQQSCLQQKQVLLDPSVERNDESKGTHENLIRAACRARARVTLHRPSRWTRR